MRKKIYTTQIEDPFAQQNFKMLGEIFQTNPFLKGQWKFIQFTVPASGTALNLKHNLGFEPIDVILLSQVGGTVTFRYNLFNENFIVYDATVTTAPLKVRALIGRYSEDTINV